MSVEIARLTGNTILVTRLIILRPSIHERAASIRFDSPAPVDSWRRPTLRRLRQCYRERGASSRIILDRNRAAVRLHDALRDAETETVAAGLLRPRAIHTKEWLKEARHVAIGDARAIIRDTDNDALAILSCGDLDGAAVREQD